MNEKKFCSLRVEVETIGVFRSLAMTQVESLHLCDGAELSKIKGG